MFKFIRNFTQIKIAAQIYFSEEPRGETVFLWGVLSPGGDLIGWFAFFTPIMLFLERLATHGDDRSSLSSLVKCLENIQGRDLRDCVGDHCYGT